MRGTGTRTSRLALFAVLATVAIGCGGASGQPTSPPPSIIIPTSTPTRATPTPDPTDSPSSTPLSTRSPDAKRPSDDAQRGRVISVVDGDTINVRIEGVQYAVRYIGIDAPERGSGPLARDATRANQLLVGDERVWLERDVSETDRFDRLLRHVWVRRGDGWLLVNEELVRLGLAYARSYPPDTMYDSTYLAAQRDAEDAETGLWAVP